MSLPRSTDGTSSEENTTQNETQSDDLFEAAVLAKGLTIPDHFKTRRQRWSMLILVGLSGACASGPIMSWPTLEPILVREHVFEGPGQLDNLSEVVSIAAGVGLSAAMLNGMFYDLFGPRWVGTVGAFGASASLFCMAIAVKVRSMNWLLWFAYPATTFFGLMNTNAVYAWYWLLPDSQNSVSSVAASIQIMSDSLVLLAVWLNKDFALSMSSYFMLVGGMAILAGVINYWFVPTLDENAATAAAVVQYRDALLAVNENEQIMAKDNSSYGSFSDGETGDISKAHSEQSTGSSALSKVKSNLADTLTWWRLYPRVNVLFNLYCFFNYMWNNYPQFEMLQLYTGLLGSKQAHRLTVVWGGVFPVAGVIFVLSFGPFVDKVGYLETIGLLLVPTIVNSVLYSVPSFYVQCVAQVLLACLANTWNVISPRFCLHFAPQELFGTIYGVQGTIVGVLQTLGTPLSTLIGNFFANEIHVKGFSAYNFTVFFWLIVYVASTIALVLYFRYNPLPAVGSCTMQEIREGQCKISGKDDEDCPDVSHKTLKKKKNEDCEKGDLKA